LQKAAQTEYLREGRIIVPGGARSMALDR
jgi:hypothetical protein